MGAGMLIAVQDAVAADNVAAWVLDLVTAGFHEVTLFHAIAGDGPSLVEELDALRPLLDRLAVGFAAHGAETDVALKRGDPVKCLVALARLRRSELIAVGATGRATTATDLLLALVADTPTPLLVLPAREADWPPLFAQPVLLTGPDDAAVLSAARAFAPTVLGAVAPSASAQLPPASLLIAGPRLAGRTLADVLSEPARPLLLFPAAVIGTGVAM